MPVLNPNTATLVLAATATASAAPLPANPGYISNVDGGVICLFVTQTAGTITACTIRVYVRPANSGAAWAEGDAVVIDPARFVKTGKVATDWTIGEVRECRFGIEAISGGTAELSAISVQS